MTDKSSQYLKHQESRSAYTNKIVDSDSDKKIIIAGPGTGKSFLFQEICKKLKGKGINDILTLSLVMSKILMTFPYNVL